MDEQLEKRENEDKAEGLRIKAYLETWPITNGLNPSKYKERVCFSILVCFS